MLSAASNRRGSGHEGATSIPCVVGQSGLLGRPAALPSARRDRVASLSLTPLETGIIFRASSRGKFFAVAFLPEESVHGVYPSPLAVRLQGPRADDRRADDADSSRQASRGVRQQPECGTRALPGFAEEVDR